MILMRIVNNINSNNPSFIDLKDDNWLKKQRIAGLIAGQTISLLENLVKTKTVKSLLELDKIAEEYIINNGCSPTFKGYLGFPNTCCISINSQLVHGIPTDYKLKDGDVVSFDLGATFEGTIGDTAITCIYGEAKKQDHIKMIETSKLCLTNAINSIKIGNNLGCIGNAIYKTARNAGFNVIENYGGHGITWDTPHAQPFVSNKSSSLEGIIIQPGLTIAIEPLLVPFNCPKKTKVGTDGWTVYTEDVSSHMEHTVFIHESHVEIITKRD